MTELLIVSAAVSVLTQIIKNTVGTSGWKSVGVVVALSVIAGAGYYQFSQDVALVEAAGEILLLSNGIYALFIKQLES